MRYTVEEIAQVCWEHNRALQIADKDTHPDEPWIAAPGWRKKILTDLIEGVLDSSLTDPMDTHFFWMTQMIMHGWKPGREKDLTRRMHPNIRPWGELAPWQRLAQQANYDTIRRMSAVA